MLDFDQHSERIMGGTPDIGNEILLFFEVYTPDFTDSHVELDHFYEALQNKVNQQSGKRKYILLGKSNTKVGQYIYFL